YHGGSPGPCTGLLQLPMSNCKQTRKTPMNDWQGKKQQCGRTSFSAAQGPDSGNSHVKRHKKMTTFRSGFSSARDSDRTTSRPLNGDPDLLLVQVWLKEIDMAS
ncbi:mCG146042, partial [Mus musculus]